MSKSNRKNVEKVVTKKLNKLIKKAANATGESRLMVMTSKDYLLVKVAKEKEGTSFIDQYLQIVRGLDNQVKMIRDYDGKDLKQVNMTPFALGTTDFAAMQGLDVDELADRDSDEPAAENSDPDTKYGEWSDKKPSRLEEYKSAPNIVDKVIKNITNPLKVEKDPIVRYGYYRDLATYERVGMIHDGVEDEHMFDFIKYWKSVPERRPYNINDLKQVINHMYERVRIDSIGYDLFVPLYEMTKESYGRIYCALIIALSVPASYAHKFIDLLIDDCKNGKFVPNEKRSVPKNFISTLENIYPQVMRLQDLLFKDVRKLPYVYKVDDSNNGRCNYFMVSTEVENSPTKLLYGDSAKEYILIPKNTNPYDYASNELNVFIRAEKGGELKDISRTDPNFTLRNYLEEYVNKHDELFKDTKKPETYNELRKFCFDNFDFYSVLKAYSLPNEMEGQNEDLSNC